MTNGSLMKVESIAVCRMLCNTLDLHEAIIGLERPIFGLFESGRFAQIYCMLVIGINKFSGVKLEYFNTQKLSHMFWMLKRSVSLRWSFGVPTTYVWLRNKFFTCVALANCRSGNVSTLSVHLHLSVRPSEALLECLVYN